MKTAAILLILLTLGFFVSGCSKTIPATPATTGNTVAEDANAADITIDTATPNADIGTLDNISVSDELPQ